MGETIGVYHIPQDRDFFNGTYMFPSGYGIILRFKENTYCGWLGIEMTSGSVSGSRVTISITTYDNFPQSSAEWKVIST